MPLLARGDVVVDGGANVGDLAKRFLSAVGPTGVVWCVEPHPVSVATLRKRFAGSPNVTAQQVALSDVEGRATLYGDGQDLRRSSLWAENRLADGAAHEVPAVRLASVLRLLPRPPKLIKLDTQGAEFRILRGSEAELSNLDVVLQVEVWPAGLKAAGDTCQALFAWLEANRFRPAEHDWGYLDRTFSRLTGHKAHDVVFVRA